MPRTEQGLQGDKEAERQPLSSRDAHLVEGAGYMVMGAQVSQSRSRVRGRTPKGEGK